MPAPKKATRKSRKKAVEAVEVSQGVETPVGAEIVPPAAPEPPETPFEEPKTPEIVDAEYEEVLHEPPLGEPEEIQETMEAASGPVELVAYCPHCGKGVKSEEWGKVAAWFGEHCQLHHPDIFQRLFGVSAAFLGLMISDMYETTPNWDDQPSMDVLRSEIMEILDGDRDPLEDGLS